MEGMDDESVLNGFVSLRILVSQRSLIYCSAITEIFLGRVVTRRKGEILSILMFIGVLIP